MSALTQTQVPDDGIVKACGTDDQSFTCELLYNWTKSESLASISEWLVERPIRIMLILLLAWIASYIAKRAIVRLTLKISRPVVDINKPLLQRLDQHSLELAKKRRSLLKKVRLTRKRCRGDEESETANENETEHDDDTHEHETEHDDDTHEHEQATTVTQPHEHQHAAAEPLSLDFNPLDQRARDRALARVETLGRVLRSLALAAIWTLAAVLMVGEIGINLGPLIAGAGIVGVALGFGAQSVVKDFLSGLFMLMEDNYGVGDMVDFGGTMGYVVDVSLRSTAFKDRDGIVWHVPNGEISKIGNLSQLGLRARLNIEVAYDTDLRMAMRVTNQVGADMWELQECRDKLAAPPKVSGIQELGASAVVIRVVVETVPGLPWPEKRKMERTFRLLLKEAYDKAGIEVPFPQQDLWIRSEGDNSKATFPPAPVTSAPTAPPTSASRLTSSDRQH